MLKMFAGGDVEPSWPLSKVVAALKNQYGGADALGEDGPLKVYGARDKGVQFAVALMQSAPGSGKIVELAFFVRFGDTPIDIGAISRINNTLQISALSREGNELYMMAGLRVTGAFNPKHFGIIMDAWGQDMAIAFHALVGEHATMPAAYATTKLAAARDFAFNRVALLEADESEPMDVLSSFLGARTTMHVFCDDCHGRGKRGLIARTCNECEGVGFIQEPAR